MRTNKIRETLLAKYTPKPKIPFHKYTSEKKKGSTLEEFYHEVYTKNALHCEQLFQNKNAQEIELIMIQNRRLIEAQRSPRR